MDKQRKENEREWYAPLVKKLKRIRDTSGSDPLTRKIKKVTTTNQKRRIIQVRFHVF